MDNTSKYKYTINWKLLKAKFATYILVIYYWNIPDVTAIYDFGIVLAMVLEYAMILKNYTFDIFLNLDSFFFYQKWFYQKYNLVEIVWGVGGGGHENYVFMYVTLIT